MLSGPRAIGAKYLYSRDLFLNLNLDVGVIGQVVADSCREVQVYLAGLLYVELLVMDADW